MAKVKRWGKKRKSERDWTAYNEQLIKRGEYYINPAFLETWIPEVKKMNAVKVGEGERDGKRWVCTEGIFSAVERIFGENVRSHKIRNSYKEAIIKFWSYQQIKNIR